MTKDAYPQNDGWDSKIRRDAATVEAITGTEDPDKAEQSIRAMLMKNREGLFSHTGSPVVPKLDSAMSGHRQIWPSGFGINDARKIVK